MALHMYLSSSYSCWLYMYVSRLGSAMEATVSQCVQEVFRKYSYMYMYTCIYMHIYSKHSPIICSIHLVLIRPSHQASSSKYVYTYIVIALTIQVLIMALSASRNK